MPRIPQYQERYAKEDFLQEIRTKQGRANLMNCKALSDVSGIPYQILLRRLQQPECFTLGEIKKLIKALRLDPITLLLFVGYAKKDLCKLETQ